MPCSRGRYREGGNLSAQSENLHAVGHLVSGSRSAPRRRWAYFMWQNIQELVPLSKSKTWLLVKFPLFIPSPPLPLPRPLHSPSLHIYSITCQLVNELPHNILWCEKQTPKGLCGHWNKPLDFIESKARSTQIGFEVSFHKPAETLAIFIVSSPLAVRLLSSPSAPGPRKPSWHLWVWVTPHGSPVSDQWAQSYPSTTSFASSPSPTSWSSPDSLRSYFSPFGNFLIESSAVEIIFRTSFFFFLIENSFRLLGTKNKWTAFLKSSTA